MSTLASHVLQCLQSSCNRFGAANALSAELQGDSSGLNDMFWAWCDTISLYSSQILLLPPVLTDREELRSFVSLTGAEPAISSPARASNLAATLLGASAASRPILALSQLIALAPLAPQSLESKQLPLHTMDQYWVQQGLMEQGSFSQPRVCSILRCILLTLKLLTLVSACSDQHQCEVQFISTVLRDILENAFQLAESCQLLKYFPRSGQTNPPSDGAVGPSQLSAAIVQVLVHLMRASIKHDRPGNNSVCCSILISLFQQPGSAAYQSKDEFMQSGGVMLLLASLNLSYGAARDGIKIISQLLRMQQRAGDNNKLVAWLLQAQAVARLSTLLEPLQGRDIQSRVMEACPGLQWMRHAACDDVFRLSQTAQTMCDILCHDPLHCPVQATVTEAPGTRVEPASAAAAAAAVTWPTPSAKAWQTIQTTALRAAALLRWACIAFEEKRQCSAGTDYNELNAYLGLVWFVMQLLAKLLTGHLDSSLDTTQLYDAHILKDVIAAYQCILEHSSAGVEDLQLIHIFVRNLLCQARQHALMPVPPLFKGKWLPADVEAILNCFCGNPLALASLPAEEALLFVQDGLAVDSALQAYFLKQSSMMAARFHNAVVLSEQQPCHLTAIVSIALLCSAEAQDKADAGKEVTYCIMAYTHCTFGHLLAALQHTTQLPLRCLAGQLGSLARLLRALCKIPQILLCKLEQDLPQLQQVLVCIVKKLLVLLGGHTQRPRLHEVADFLVLVYEFADTLPGDSVTKIAKDAFGALTDLSVVSLKQSLAPIETVCPLFESAGLRPEILHAVMDWLFVRTFPSDTHLLYFGEEAFPLVQQWLVQYAEDRKQAGRAAGFLIHPIGLGYGKMLASYRKMYGNDQVASQMPPPVDAACAWLTHLFTVVDQLVLQHKHSERMRATQSLRTADNVLTHDIALKQATAVAQSLTSELHTTLQGFMTFADDNQMAEGLKKKGSMAWCIDPKNPYRVIDIDTLQQHLTYLRSRMRLSTDAAALHEAFKLTMSHTPAGQAAGEQHMLDEQQAAAKAAARKAKKLRQRESKQQAKQAAQADLAQETDARESAPTAAVSANHAVQDPILPATAIQLEDIPLAEAISTSDISVRHSEELDHVRNTFCSASDKIQEVQPSSAAQAGPGTPEIDSQPPSSTLNTQLTHMRKLLCCPITKAQMADCVIAADGFSYEREAITRWLQLSNKSPVDGKTLQHNCLLPNFSLRKVIDSFSVKHQLM